jgi:hypothetical protein
VLYVVFADALSAKITASLGAHLELSILLTVLPTSASKQCNVAIAVVPEVKGTHCEA